jgi:hypothetical protein
LSVLSAGLLILVCAPTQAPAASPPARAEIPAAAPISIPPAILAPATQTAGSPGEEAPAASAIPAGLCQCIGNLANLDFHCPESADACQMQCGGERFSFVPSAQCRAEAH